jgi:prepilin peptidase CpaA
MGGTNGLEPIYLHATVLLLAGVAAFTDVRRGEIPNWLTLPVLALAPIVHGWDAGFGGVLDSLVGMLVCAIVPLILFYRGGMAGGDVKLFAAIGAVGGIYVGLEAQLLSLIVASIYAIGQLAWNGKLLTSLTNSLLLGLNPVLPRKWRRTIAPELMHRIRLGAAILCGSAIAIAGHHQGLWA